MGIDHLFDKDGFMIEHPEKKPQSICEQTGHCKPLPPPIPHPDHECHCHDKPFDRPHHHPCHGPEHMPVVNEHGGAIHIHDVRHIGKRMDILEQTVFKFKKEMDKSVADLKKEIDGKLKDNALRLEEAVENFQDKFESEATKLCEAMDNINSDINAMDVRVKAVEDLMALVGQIPALISRIELLEHQNEELRNSIAAMDNKFELVYNEMNSNRSDLKADIDALDSKYSDIRELIMGTDGINAAILSVDTKVDNAVSNMTTYADSKQALSQNQINAINTNIQGYGALTTNVAGLITFKNETNTWVGNANAKFAKIQTDIANLTKKVG